MTTISATTVLRSRNASRPDKVLTTLLLRYPRWIHAEFLTHRAFSRNAASSRAIPVEKQIEAILDDPAMPIVWTKNEPGMQGYTLMTPDEAHAARTVWSLNMRRDIEGARLMQDLGAHKQIVNRLLEPHMHITVLTSGTEWENFLELRDHHAAEPHFQMLAREIRKCLEADDFIQELRPGEWHLPFITEQDRCNADTMVGGEDVLKTLSVARCASTSYKTVDGFDMNYERATQIYDKLVTSKPVHASPLEHVAQADDWWNDLTLKTPGGGKWTHTEEHGNFEGFRQLRFQL
jgi:hypothetical protein